MWEYFISTQFIDNRLILFFRDSMKFTLQDDQMLDNPIIVCMTFDSFKIWFDYFKLGKDERKVKSLENNQYLIWLILLIFR